jgi:hypothetical protein
VEVTLWCLHFGIFISSNTMCQYAGKNLFPAVPPKPFPRCTVTLSCKGGGFQYWSVVARVEAIVSMSARCSKGDG